MLRLTKYGRRELVVCSLMAELLIVAVLLVAWRWSFWLALAVIVPAALWGWVLAFFRDPDRTSPKGQGLFLAPADGRVTDITPLGHDSPLGREGVQVGIFMSVFDVHVNRAPCDGTIEKIEHRDGGYGDVRHPAAWVANESTTIHMTASYEGRPAPVVFRQVAGLVARRIVTDLKPGEPVLRGQRVGMIKFGSRVELMVPGELAPKVLVAVGDRVVAGQTVLVEAQGARP